MIDKIKEFIGEAYYDADGQMIFGKTKDDNNQLLSNFDISVRGWGAIQYLFEDQKEAIKFQDEVGKFIADAINEKINREV